jgi:hypothetical protein
VILPGHAGVATGAGLGIAAAGGAGREAAEVAAAPTGQSCDAHRSARPHHSPEGDRPGHTSRRSVAGVRSPRAQGYVGVAGARGAGRQDHRCADRALAGAATPFEAGPGAAAQRGTSGNPAGLGRSRRRGVRPQVERLGRLRPPDGWAILHAGVAHCHAAVRRRRARAAAGQPRLPFPLGVHATDRAGAGGRRPAPPAAPAPSRRDLLLRGTWRAHRRPREPVEPGTTLRGRISHTW